MIYWNVVMVLNFLVDWLLLMAANRLLGYPASPGRTAIGGLTGALYGGACMLPGMGFLGNLLWRTVMLSLVAMVGYGFHRSALRRGILFLLLSMALGGILQGLGSVGFWKVIVGAGVICLCTFLLRGRLSGGGYMPVELTYGENRLKLTALQDTGNTLHDPLTGNPVLVVDRDVAGRLTGLTRQQLQKPVESIGALPGLRLIPYKTVGTEGGLLLALKLPKVRIGHWQGSCLVAFAPEQLSSDGEYQALTGGMT